jgi:exonuclease VII small subunit
MLYSEAEIDEHLRKLEIRIEELENRVKDLEEESVRYDDAISSLEWNSQYHGDEE